jgi:glutamine amidotransferase
MSSPKIAIIDYKMSNLFSIRNALKFLDIEANITSNANEILSSDGAILPGVGSYPEAVKHLHDLEIFESIKDFIKTGKPFMGICLGLQLLFTKSEEFQSTMGLNIIPGSVKNLKENVKTVPHVGWNSVKLNKDNACSENNSLEDTIKEGSYFYFVHSYFVEPENKSNIKTFTEHQGKTFCSSVMIDNIFASQFHPEKSGKDGLAILRNFFKK